MNFSYTTSPSPDCGARQRHMQTNGVGSAAFRLRASGTADSPSKRRRRKWHGAFAERTVL
jgi:hypothetical protein